MPISDLIPWKRAGTEQNPEVENSLALSNLQRDINSLFEDFFEQPFGIRSFWDEGSRFKGFIPDLDLNETEKEVILSADLPGINPEEIDISITGDTLTISGEKTLEDEQKEEGYFRRERSYGSFRRSINLPAAVDEDKAQARYKRGVLKVVLPKTPDEKSPKTKIKINQG